MSDKPLSERMLSAATPYFPTADRTNPVTFAWVVREWATEVSALERSKADLERGMETTTQLFIAEKAESARARFEASCRDGDVAERDEKIADLERRVAALTAALHPGPMPEGGVNRGNKAHWSDCALHNEPAFRAEPCDCGGYSAWEAWRCHSSTSEVYRQALDWCVRANRYEQLTGLKADAPNEGEG